MNDSDDKIPDIGEEISAETTETNEQTVAPEPQPRSDEARARAESDPRSARSAFVGELVALSVKAVAVALSVVVMLLSILASALPLSAMRVFNELGMSSRALDFGRRYIDRTLSDYDVPEYALIGVAETGGSNGRRGRPLPAELCSDEFIEALDVGINLSYKLASRAYADGNSSDAKYYAEYLELYTRMYTAISGIADVNAAKDAAAFVVLPPAQRPYMYSNSHSIKVMNFRARAYLGTLDNMLYNSNTSGDCVWRTADAANSFGGLMIKDYDTSTSSGREQLAAVLDRFVDYVDCLGAYISIEFERLGITGGVSESSASTVYKGIAENGDFSLFVTEAGFGNIYRQLDGTTTFRDYAQAAVDFPAAGLDAQLRKLYWMQTLAGFSTKMWYMSMILRYSRENFGAASSAIESEYSKPSTPSNPGGAGTCELYKFVEHGGRLQQISEVYSEYILQYINAFEA